jgi:hypothetical protein
MADLAKAIKDEMYERKVYRITSDESIFAAVEACVRGAVEKVYASDPTLFLDFPEFKVIKVTCSRDGRLEWTMDALNEPARLLNRQANESNIGVSLEDGSYS